MPVVEQRTEGAQRLGRIGGGARREVSSVCRAMPAMNDSPASSARATASVRYRAACRVAPLGPALAARVHQPGADGHRPGPRRELGQLRLVPRLSSWSPA